MAVKMMTGDIMSNWGECGVIYLSAHTDINPGGDYYLSNSILAALKNNIPDFNDIFRDKINEAKKHHGKSDIYGVATHKVEKDGKLIQRIGLIYLRDKWDAPPRPDLFKNFMDGLFSRISIFVMYNQTVPRILIQDPITADIKPGPKTTEAFERLYGFYPPYVEVWRPG